jgi:HlyD family secretion protein
MNAPRRRLRVTLIAIAVCLAAAALLYRYLRPAPETVEIGRVTRGPLEITLDEEGQTRIRPRHVVAAPVAGRLLPVEVDEGDAVACGEVVARLAPLPLDARAREAATARRDAALAAAREARARIAEAEALAAQGASSLERKRRLAAQGVVAAEELELASTSERTAREGLAAAREHAEAAECEAAAARSVLLEAERGATVELRAPISGEVLRRFEESERVLTAGEPILEIGDRRNLEIAVEVLSTDAVALRPGMPMRVEAGLAAPLAAALERIEPAAFTKVSPLGVEEQRVMVIGRLAEPAPALGDRFRVRATIVLWRGEDVVQVSTGALFRAGSGAGGAADAWAVYRVEEGRARLSEVTVGRRGVRSAEILTGLEEGAEVVLYPSEKVAAGVRLERAPVER